MTVPKPCMCLWVLVDLNCACQLLPKWNGSDDSFKKKASRMEQRDKLGLSPRGKNANRQYGEATSAMDKVQVRQCSAR